jgi:hypothetical protein
MKPKYKVYVFKDAVAEEVWQGAQPAPRQVWRWHLKSLTGKAKVVATSGEAFDTRGNAIRAGKRMRDMLAIDVAFEVDQDCDLSVEGSCSPE